MNLGVTCSRDEFFGDALRESKAESEEIVLCSVSCLHRLSESGYIRC